MNPTGPVSLGGLAAALGPFNPLLSGEGRTPLLGITQDSRRVSLGDLFVARAGERASGLSFVDQASLQGAAAVLSDVPRPVSCSLPWLQVESLTRALAHAAEFVHGSPSRALKLAGVTGTNGKTTTTHLVDATLRALKVPSARLGTLGFLGVQSMAEASLTTPEADVISRYLRQACDDGARHFVMEVSSHALAKARVEACFFEVAAFSNLSQDHLDYHGTLEDYAETKATLFSDGRFRHAVINVDDAFGLKLAERVAARSGSSLLRVSQRGGAGEGVRLIEQQTNAHGTAMRVQLPDRELSFRTQLVSEHNRDNWLLALGILFALEVDLTDFPSLSNSVPSAPGRLQRCEDSSDDICVLVDYAHTPDALVNALRACRGFCQGRVLCVFGCGGDRDPDKRAKMGAAVAEHADYGIVTNDNPRSEEPARIADAIVLGMEGAAGAFEVCLERDQAILRAVLMAKPQDCVLIAGKGHEDYQIIGDERRHFDDAMQAKAALKARRILQTKSATDGRS